jgi:hypothetical protein
MTARDYPIAVITGIGPELIAAAVDGARALADAIVRHLSSRGGTR